MDYDKVRSLLLAERADAEKALRHVESAAASDRKVESDPGDAADAAQSLIAQGDDAAIIGGLRDRLDAIDRAMKRLDDRTYGRSVRSGLPIPEERLEADPAAELTVEEARQAS